jgi:cystathionine beta-lyase/cystathionine gamma-synthase
LSSTYAQKDLGKFYGKFEYTRIGNPTRDALEKCLTAIEYGNYAVTFSSGCGATSTITNIFKSGDHLVLSDDVYGGTRRYIERYAV